MLQSQNREYVLPLTSDLSPRTLSRRLRKELRSFLTQPGLLRVFKTDSIRRGIDRLLVRHPGAWDSTEPGIAVRRYGSYDEYLNHQRSKLSKLNLGQYEATLRAALSSRLLEYEVDWSKKNVLCLGARLGAEVRAFRDVGAFAVGIDLNPGPNNDLVLLGDFHALQFADASVDVVYTNCLDHAFDLGRVIAEIHRVLNAQGMCLLELGPSTTEPAHDSWESTAWSVADEVVARFEVAGFEVGARRPITVPHSLVEHVQLLMHSPDDPSRRPQR